MIIPDKKVSKNPFLGFNEKKIFDIALKAVETGNIKRLKLLLQTGLNVNKELYSTTLLTTSIGFYILNILKFLLSLPNIDVNYQSKDIYSPLVFSVKTNNLEAVKLLIKHPDINVNLVDEEGKTALYFAENLIIGKEDMPYNVIEILKILKQHGATK
jgi:ankyrin repeat protein